MYCQKCGKENNDDALFCQGCGSPLQNGVTANNVVQNKKKKGGGKKAIIAIVIILIVIAVCATIFFFFGGKEMLTEATTTTAKVTTTTKVYTTTTTAPTSSVYDAPDIDMSDYSSPEAYKKICKEVSYKDIERNPSNYEGANVVFTGEVIQVLEEDDGTTSYRVAVTKDENGNYDDPVLVSYQRQDGEERVLENDIVTLYGLCDGVYTYESVMGGSITVPMVYALIIEIQK